MRKILIIGIVMVLVTMVQAFAASTYVQQPNLVDNFNDQSVNTSVWAVTTQNQGSCTGAVNELASGEIQVISAPGTGGACVGFANITSKIPFNNNIDIIEIKNLRTSLGTASGATFNINITLGGINLVGNKDLAGTLPSNGKQNMTIVKNQSVFNRWDVYYGGTFLDFAIVPSPTNISLFSKYEILTSASTSNNAAILADEISYGTSGFEITAIEAIKNITIQEFNSTVQLLTPLNTSLISYWNFENGKATDLIDSNNGTLIASPSFVSGAIRNDTFVEGKAIKFNGATQYVNVPHNNNLNFNRNFSLAFWVKRDSFSSGDKGIIHKGTDASKQGFRVLIRNGNKVRFSNGDGGWRDTDSNAELANTSWNHVAITYDQTNVRIYINGKLDQTNAENRAIGNSTNPLRMGIRPNNADFYDGALDEVVILNTTLSASEINKLYNTGLNNSVANINNILMQTTTGSINTNLTSANGTILSVLTTSNTYFNETKTNVNPSNDLVVEMHQARINFRTFQLNTSTELFPSYLIDGIPIVGAQANITSGTHNVTTKLAGHYDKTESFTLSIGEIKDLNITDVYNSLVRVNATFIVNGSLVTNYTATVLNNTGGFFGNFTNSTGSDISIPLILGNYTLKFNKAALGAGDKTVLSTSNLTNITFEVATLNSFNFTAKDEISGASIQNFTVDLIGQFTSGNFTTTNGSIFVDLLIPDTYQIVYDSNEKAYSQRSTFFTLLEGSATNITLELLVGTEIIVEVLNQNNNPQEGYYVLVQKFNPGTSTYETKEILQTNGEGKGTAVIEFNSKTYRFVVQNPLGNTIHITSPSQIFETTVTIKINQGQAVVQSAEQTGDDIFSIQNTLFYNKAAGTFDLDYSDVSNKGSQYCLSVNKLTRTGETQLNETCITSTSGFINISAPAVNGTTYLAKFRVKFVRTGAFETIDSLIKQFIPTAQTGKLGLFLIVIVTIAFGFIFRGSPTMMLIGLPIPLLLASVVGFIDIGWQSIIPFVMVGAFLAAWMSKDL